MTNPRCKFPLSAQSVLPTPGADVLRVFYGKIHRMISRETSFRIGEIVRLNSGGPKMLVVDTTLERITAAWRGADGAEEIELPSACVHRVSPLD